VKCFFKNDIKSDNPCQICGNNYFNKSGIINNTYINCYKCKEGYYIDDEILDYNPCYSSCKKCFIGGDESEHNFIECKEEYKYEFDISIYKNCLINIDEEKRIEMHKRKVQNMIDNVFDKLNISDIDNGNDEKTNKKNLSVIMTSTKNQKKNENEKMVTIDLGKCENILKNEYNISENDSLYIFNF